MQLPQEAQELTSSLFLPLTQLDKFNSLLEDVLTNEGDPQLFSLPLLLSYLTLAKTLEGNNEKVEQVILRTLPSLENPILKTFLEIVLDNL